MNTLLNKYKGIAPAELGSGDSILFWDDMWNDKVLEFTYPQLFSFATDTKMVVQSILQMKSFQDMFQLPLSVEAYDQFFVN
jgi:hypothetical protein